MGPSLNRVDQGSVAYKCSRLVQTDPSLALVCVGSRQTNRHHRWSGYILPWLDLLTLEAIALLQRLRAGDTEDKLRLR